MQVTVAKGKFLDGMSMPGTRQGVKAKRKRSGKLSVSIGWIQSGT
jgi:hypothetical protein